MVDKDTRSARAGSRRGSAVWGDTRKIELDEAVSSPRSVGGRGRIQYAALLYRSGVPDGDIGSRPG